MQRRYRAPLRQAWPHGGLDLPSLLPFGAPSSRADYLPHARLAGSCRRPPAARRAWPPSCSSWPAEGFPTSSRPAWSPASLWMPPTAGPSCAHLAHLACERGAAGACPAPDTRLPAAALAAGTRRRPGPPRAVAQLPPAPGCLQSGAARRTQLPRLLRLPPLRSGRLHPRIQLHSGACPRLSLLLHAAGCKAPWGLAQRRPTPACSRTRRRGAVATFMS